MENSKFKIQNSKLQFKIKNFKFCIVTLMVRLRSPSILSVIEGLIFTFCILNLLMGCATYKFQRGREPHSKGYVVSRDDYTILEYTIGKDNSTPELELAKRRFNKRRKMVEHYYKKMGYIENHFKMAFWDPGVLFVKLIGGVFRLPFIAISDYRYAHSPQYKERIRKIEDEKDRREEARIKKLKDTLDVYIQRALASEQDIEAWGKTPDIKLTQQEVLKETLDRIEQGIAKEKQLPQEESVQPKEEQPDIRLEGEPNIPVEKKVEPSQTKRTKLSGQPIAIIIAKPIKGFSPLRVRFYGYKSYAPNGKIVSYLWDFGDGDTSTAVNPVNTYYSGSSEPIHSTATLTIQDDKGNTAKVSTTIKVLNR